MLRINTADSGSPNLWLSQKCSDHPKNGCSQKPPAPFPSVPIPLHPQDTGHPVCPLLLPLADLGCWPMERKRQGASRSCAHSGGFIAIIPHPLPLAEAQDEGLPILGSVVSNPCGEGQWFGVRQQPWGCRGPLPPPQGHPPTTHPSAGGCWARSGAANSSASPAGPPVPAPGSGRGPEGCPGCGTWGLDSGVRG